MPRAYELPNIRHLRAFSLVARHNSVKKAALAIYLSQPAVTQAISKLEELFGCPFFVRRRTGMYCTPYGELVRARVERALEAISSALSRPSGQGRQPLSASDDPIRLLSTAHLRAIVAVADHGSFAPAAKSLGISQPSLHRTARTLEQIVGLKLFVRSSQGMSLAPHGERLSRGAKLAMREIELAFEDLNLSRGLANGRITIGSLPLARTYIVPKAVTELTARYPELRVSIVDGPYDAMLRGLRTGEIDFMVGALRQPAPAADVTERVLFHDPLSVVARYGHPLTRKSKLVVKDLACYPWIVPRHGTPTRGHFEQMFVTRSLEPPSHPMEVSSMVTVRALLLESDLLTLLSRHQIRYEEQLSQLVTLPIALPDTRRAIGLTMRRDWQPTKPQQELVGLIEEIAALQAAEGEFDIFTPAEFRGCEMSRSS
jgi:LysR family transcriptional regulator, regulator for genes of the gallate degradation pathway